MILFVYEGSLFTFCIIICFALLIVFFLYCFTKFVLLGSLEASDVYLVFKWLSYLMRQFGIQGGHSFNVNQRFPNWEALTSLKGAVKKLVTVQNFPNFCKSFAFEYLE